MKGASKVIMGATLVMVVTLAIVLGLILVLLAELYCSLLLRRRQLNKSSSVDATISKAVTAPAATAASTLPTNPTSSIIPPPQDHQSTCNPLSSIYAQGVLHAPRNFLFPSPFPTKQNKLEEQNHLTLLHQILEVHSQESNTCSPHQIGILSSSPVSSTSFATSPQPAQEISIQVCPAGNTTTTGVEENLVYISNPIYDNDGAGCRPSMPGTPFETPDSSPSRLENSGSSGDDDIIDHDEKAAEPSDPVRVLLYSPPITPPLSPMKKLPAQACSVSLRDATSLGTNSCSESNSHNGTLSSSSSASPCTSPSW